MLVLASVTGCFASQLTQQADSAYNCEDYRLAIKLYGRALDSEGVSPDLLYNMGNAYYRIGDVGHAVLYYERTLALDPSHADTRANLGFVRSRIADRPEDDSSYLTNLHRSICALLSPDAWAWVGFGCFAFMLGLVALYVFSADVSLRKLGFFGAFVMLVVVVYVSVVAWSVSSAYYAGNRAVVVAPAANLRTAPGSDASGDGKIITLPQGSVLEITDSMSIPGSTVNSLWYDVKINNASRAWVNAADIERI